VAVLFVFLGLEHATAIEDLAHDTGNNLLFKKSKIYNKYFFCAFIDLALATVINFKPMAQTNGTNMDLISRQKISL
jgi:hypothetical protein